jgi:hypothetical protein
MKLRFIPKMRASQFMSDLPGNEKDEKCITTARLVLSKISESGAKLHHQECRPDHVRLQPQQLDHHQ